MPYIPNDQPLPTLPKGERDALDPIIDQLVEVIKEIVVGKDIRDADGRCNYTICELLMKVFDIPSAPRYTKLNTMDGVLSQVGRELFRRIGGPYEDIAILKNTDIETFKAFQKWQAEQKAKLLGKDDC